MPEVNHTAPEQTGRGAIMLKYAAIGEWIPFAGTLLCVIVVSYAASVLGWINSSFYAVLLFFVVLLVLEAITATYKIWKRNSTIKNNAMLPSKPPIPKKPLLPGEKAVAVIAPINIRKILDLRLLNDYRSIYPDWYQQNSLIITNHGLLFVYAPLYLGDQMLGRGASVADSNFMWASKEIVESINNLLVKYALKDAYESYPANFRLGFDEIDSVRHPDLPQILFIKAKTGQYFTVTVRSSDDYQKAKQVLQQNGF